MFKSLGWPEILIILVILVMFFGLGKLPQVGESIGKAIRGFKKASSDDTDEEKVVTAKKTDKDEPKSDTKEKS